MNESYERAKERCVALGCKPSARLITVSLEHQTLSLWRDDCLVKTYVVSTSLRPPSNVRDSLGTPRGLHTIAERIGAGSPPGIVFRARVSTGRHFSELPAEEQAKNLITSRILWLRGLEPGVNQGGDVDTHSRYIYLHGTNHEDRLGTPSSGGCVQLRNLDIIELYEHVRPGDLVWIED